MKCPYPWFGGKTQVASAVWERFGDVVNYVEPFFGGGAVLLNRPAWHTGRTETVNDINAWLTNFWRAVKADPEAVAQHADWPVNEIDLAARRDWLFARKDYIEKMMLDPDWYDAKLAGVWVWGICSTIGDAWNLKGAHLGPGMGVHRRARAHLGNAGMGATRLEVLIEHFKSLQARMERVRVMCGDWKRVTSPSVTVHHGLTGMFLDPPYIDNCNTSVYDEYNGDVRDEVRAYALEHGEEMRIALCGYEGEHEMPDTWECYRWQARGGYGNKSDRQGSKNKYRERIWFSPACLQAELFQVKGQ